MSWSTLCFCTHNTDLEPVHPSHLQAVHPSHLHFQLPLQAVLLHLAVPSLHRPGTLPLTLPLSQPLTQVSTQQPTQVLTQQPTLVLTQQLTQVSTPQLSLVEPPMQVWTPDGHCLVVRLMRDAHFLAEMLACLPWVLVLLMMVVKLACLQMLAGRRVWWQMVGDQRQQKSGVMMAWQQIQGERLALQLLSLDGTLLYMTPPPKNNTVQYKHIIYYQIMANLAT